MRDPRQTAKKLLVELGGWFPERVAVAEASVSASADATRIAPRLIALRSGSPSPLHLAGARFVLADLGQLVPGEAPPELDGLLRGSFAIRFRDPLHQIGDIDRRLIISSVWRTHPHPRVDLGRPDHALFVYPVQRGIRMGVLIGECSPELKLKGRRPFVRSYELPPRKARLLVNLSGARPGQRFLDPCAGTGSVVIEAARIGCVATGSDIDERAARGASTNIESCRVVASSLRADAGALPFRTLNFDAVATDLPYGRSAARRGSIASDFVRRMLAELVGCVAEGSRAVLMAMHDHQPVPAVEGWQDVSRILLDARHFTRSITTWQRC